MKEGIWAVVVGVAIGLCAVLLVAATECARRGGNIYWWPSGTKCYRLVEVPVCDPSNAACPTFK
jgi:hypothetical protein